MKLAQLTSSAFQLSLQKLTKGNPPATVKWKVKGIIKRVDEEYHKYEELRQDLLKQYGKKREDGGLDMDERGNVHFEGNSHLEFSKAFSELVNVEVELPTVSLSKELGDSVPLEVEDLLILEGLVTE